MQNSRSKFNFFYKFRIRNSIKIVWVSIHPHLRLSGYFQSILCIFKEALRAIAFCSPLCAIVREACISAKQLKAIKVYQKCKSKRIILPKSN